LFGLLVTAVALPAAGGAPAPVLAGVVCAWAGALADELVLLVPLPQPAARSASVAIAPIGKPWRNSLRASRLTSVDGPILSARRLFGANLPGRSETPGRTRLG
jgi:hypothetical protein